MTEETTPPEGGAEFKPITSQEELNRLIGARISTVKSQYADYDEIKAKAAKFDAADEASKTELQKVADRAAAAERERDELRLASARAEVALAKGLTPTQAKRLVGTTKDELEADADELLADLGGTKPDAKKPDAKKLQSGSRGGGDNTAGLSGKERAAELLKQYRASSH